MHDNGENKKDMKMAMSKDIPDEYDSFFACISVWPQKIVATVQLLKV